MEALTKKQKEVLDYIVQKIEEKGVAPSYREIAKRFRLRSLATVALHVRALIRKGCLAREKWRARGLTPTGYASPTPGSLIPVPLLSGFLPAGPTQELSEEVEKTLFIDRYLLKGSGRDCFAMKVRGISMTGAGIEDGDMVVAKRQQFADPRNLVIALKDGEVTLKRFIPQDGGVLLKAENPQAQSYFIPLKADDQRVKGIIGKVIKVIKDVKP
ncbi:MAG: repressor LexA [Elusimicrobia bacterium]|nr:repressor LexA [Elusimicrobiota bacterium]